MRPGSLFLLWLAAGAWFGCTQSAAPRPLVVDPPAMYYTLEGHVTDPAGQSLAEVAVSIREAPGSVPDLATLTNADGRFTLHDLPGGTYVLRLVGPSGEAADQRVLVDGSAATVEFRIP